MDAKNGRKYLTPSWWILNVGWKDLGEGVHKGVANEDVLDEQFLSRCSDRGHDVIQAVFGA